MKITISWFKNVFTENSIDRRTLVFCHFFPKFSENMRILMSITFHWKLWWSSREDQLQRNWPLSDRLPIHIYFFSSLLVFLFHKGYYNTTKKMHYSQSYICIGRRSDGFFSERDNTSINDRLLVKLTWCLINVLSYWRTKQHIIS